MTPYFSTITCINIFSLVILFVLVSGNSIISTHQKNKFQTTGAIVFLICIMEVFTMIFDNTPPKFKFFHIASNYIGFSLTPAVYVSLSKALFPHIGENRFKINPMVLLCVIYSLWLLVSLIATPKYSVFYVDKENHYSRAKGFFIFCLQISGFLFVSGKITESYFFLTFCLFFLEPQFKFFIPKFKSPGLQ